MSHHPKTIDRGAGSRVVCGVAIIAVFLAVVGLKAWVAPWHQLLLWMHALTGGVLAHASLEAILSSIKQLLTVCLCALTATWLFGGGVPQALENLGVRRGIVRGVVVGVVATLPLPIMYAIWWHVSFTADIAVQVIVFGVVAAIGEEVLYRGFAFGLLYRKLRLSFWLSIILPTVLFARGHLYQVHGIREYLAIVALTGFGNIWFGWLYVRWDYNLWVPIAVHALMNSWWTIFSVSETALGPRAGYYARLMTVVLSVALTLWHCGWDWRRAFLRIRPEEPESTSTPGPHAVTIGAESHNGGV